ncbi:inorganic phosphate transporter [Leptolyngbya sp. NIES-2104]|uniref:inorganic phosphate transporter n=1 Tax=Leptolyngbya sp. NIES-2104 TaxID=1552121 RepID=UPI0006EC6E8A|nr:inorganic phosphate transporter [Leptolyngbya sp. NIES-2104]GAP99428.1 probable low-affinity inorganic phosphate transporter [Leptolyngbya sp. NIES-2104]
MYIALLFLATLFLAFSNGANDNFKGVATLFGSQTTRYKTAIAWATITTFAGSVCSIFLASALVKSFSGKGLVPDAIANGTDFHLAIALATGITVILATQLGFPISTTHALTGSLVGAGLVAIGTQVNFTALQKSFILPLLLSPILAIPLAVIVYSTAHFLRVRLGIEKENCVCVGEPVMQFAATDMRVSAPELATGSVESCNQRYQGRVWGVQNQRLIDAAHFLSAGVVSFARGLNDTPKIVPLLIGIQAISMQGGAIAIAILMAIGGLLNARKVAETMSKRITAMNAGQGFSANLITGILVIAASRFGLPVSTTHVSVGSIFGVGLVSRQANGRVFLQILLSWVLTLPIAALLSALFYWMLHR